MSREPMDDETWEHHIAKWRGQIIGADTTVPNFYRTVTWDKYTKLKIVAGWLEENFPETLKAWKIYREEQMNAIYIIPNEVCELVEELVAVGEKEPKNRETIVNSCKAMLRGYHGYPYYRSGRMASDKDMKKWEGLNK